MRCPWTIHCAGGCNTTIEIPAKPKGGPDWNALKAPWRGFSYVSKNIGKAGPVGACSDACEQKFRGLYEGPVESA